MSSKVMCNKCGTKDIWQTEEYLRAGCYYCPICGSDLTKLGNIIVQKEKEFEEKQ